MSFPSHHPDSSIERASHSSPRASISGPPPTQMPPYSQNNSYQLPYEPNARTRPDYGPGQPLAQPHVNMPWPEPNYQPFWAPSPSNQHLLTRAHGQSSDGLEDHLRHMILRNDPLPGHPKPTLDTPSQASAAPKQGGFRRPNQNQRKQQAQQVHLSWQNPPVSTNMVDARPTGRLPHHGPRISTEVYGGYRQPVSNPMQYDISQRRPHAALSQPRSLFDPRGGPGVGWAENRGNRMQVADNHAQLTYIDQLARVKISEVEISPEELSEKHVLKQRLNEICREVILGHELISNPNVSRESVELKSFGSLSIGFATKESDMDLVLVSPESKPELSSPESLLPRMVEIALMNHGYGARLLTQTRVPIIKFCESPDAELSANLRLTRLHWEKESESHDERANSEAAVESSGTSAGEAENFRPQDTPDQTPSTLKDPIVQDDNRIETVTPAENDKPPLRKVLELDPAWLPKLSDHELVGLFRAAMKEDRCEPHQKTTIMATLNILADQSASRDHNVLQESREKLLNLSDVVKECRVPSRGDLDFPKDGVGTQCDINFSNQLALHNSLLLKCYALCDPRVRQMVLFVKAWTKRRKINSPYHGTLNSYGYVLMVLHFLMNVAQPPLIPNLQLATEMIRNDPLSTREVSLDGYNIQFFRNEGALQEMARNGVFGQNKESLGSLLRGFFQFFANPPFGTFSWKDDVLSLRTKGGILTKVGKGWVGARTETVDLAGPGLGHKKVNHHYVVAIEDPFETGHNVARTVFFNGVVAIRDEFRRAVDIISIAGGDPRTGPQDLFAEGKKNENLQHRSGPPRKDGKPKSNGGSIKSESFEKDTSLKKNGVNQNARHVSQGTNKPAPRETPKAGSVLLDNRIPKPHNPSAPAANLASLPSKSLDDSATATNSKSLSPKPP